MVRGSWNKSADPASKCRTTEKTYNTIAKLLPKVSYALCAGNRWPYRGTAAIFSKKITDAFPIVLVFQDNRMHLNTWILQNTNAWYPNIRIRQYTKNIRIVQNIQKDVAITMACLESKTTHVRAPLRANFSKTRCLKYQQKCMISQHPHSTIYKKYADCLKYTERRRHYDGMFGIKNDARTCVVRAPFVSLFCIF